jgi:RNA polymerase sigma factor (TIGR02999 family)
MPSERRLAAVQRHRTGELTALLKAWSRGDETALERLTPLVYEELRQLARRHIRQERAGQSLQQTALVNEAYLRLVEVAGIDWQNRTHFFSVSSRVMRRVLVDAARSRAAQKRGGGVKRADSEIELDQLPARGSDRAAELCALDDALDALARMDPRRAQVIELRFFGGLSVEETAYVLNVSPQTVMRDWKLARAWLTRELQK